MKVKLSSNVKSTSSSNVNKQVNHENPTDTIETVACAMELAVLQSYLLILIYVYKYHLCVFNIHLNNALFRCFNKNFGFPITCYINDLQCYQHEWIVCPCNMDCLSETVLKDLGSASLTFNQTKSIIALNQAALIKVNIPSTASRDASGKIKSVLLHI